jgi:DNA-directed RNA polymerase specialized sigma24 family protein
MEIARSVPVELDLEAELVTAYPFLVRRLTLVLHDGDAGQDVAQAAFARALERRDRFHGGDARGWLYTIGLRLAFNELSRYLGHSSTMPTRRYAQQTPDSLGAQAAEALARAGLTDA